MRRKATKPKKWKKRSVLNLFHKIYTEDQLERWLCCPQWAQVKAGYHLPVRLMAHHIFHNGTRADRRCNLIMVTSRAHEFIHKHPIAGTAMSMYVVMQRESHRLGKVYKDWGRCFAECPVGWLSNRLEKGEIPEPYRIYAIATLAAFLV